MQFDWTVRVTDLVMMLAVVAGPILAVQVAEYLRKSQGKRKRKLHIFHTLMATRSATLAPRHIDAINAVEVEFHSGNPQDKRVIDAWKLYIAHLNDINFPRESWGVRRVDLMIEMLYEMGLALGYSFDKAHIKGGAYYPQGFGEVDMDHYETRKLWLEVLRGQRQIPMRAEVYAPHEAPRPPQAQELTAPAAPATNPTQPSATS